MDDRVWWLALGTLGLSGFALALDAAFGQAFEVSSEFYIVLSAVLTFLGVVVGTGNARKNGKNGKNGQSDA